MDSLLSFVTGFGLASGAGARASVAVLILGLFHYTPYFELSERWLWIASPQTMVVLAILVAVEFYVDAHPELGRWGDVAAYLPKLVAGFLVFAAATGAVDDSLLKLGASGLLGGGTAVGVHWLRNLVRAPFRDHAEEIHHGFGKFASLGEMGVAASVSVSALAFPPVALILLAVLFAVAFWIARYLDRRRMACVHCGLPIRPGAVVCKHCGGDQVKVGSAV
ncbi:MAG: DUF4126 family protein [Acidobacteria bacterium]|nr:DUF4126 family protein [Acidobacteriota bacterium]